MGSLRSGAQLNKLDNCLFYEDIITRLLIKDSYQKSIFIISEISYFLPLVTEKVFAQPTLTLHRSGVICMRKLSSFEAYQCKKDYNPTFLPSDAVYIIPKKFTFKA